MDDNLNPVIIISGPTATGKTSTSIMVAQYIKTQYKKDAVIVNFDSLLFYQELNIGTAKPSIKERDGIEHYMIDTNSIKSPLNAADYCILANKYIEELHTLKKVVILVGGSGFYLRALIKGMYESKTIPMELKASIQKEYEEKGIQFIRNFLKEFDPSSYHSLHENDHYRNIRAYEHFKNTKSPLSLEKEKIEKSKPYDFSITKHPNWKLLHFYLDVEKELHQKIIRDRVKDMLKQGLVEEVKTLLHSQNITGEEKPLKSIGYKETLQYLKKEIVSEEEYIERISISTRQLAKAQRTFFNKVTPKILINPIDGKEEILTQIDKFI